MKNIKNLVITGFSGGAGKTYLYKKICEYLGDTHQFSISHTSRRPRPGEEDGKHYHFIHPNQFRKMIRAGAFLEWNQAREEEFYGTTLEEYSRIRFSEKALIFDVDYVGVQQLRQKEYIPVYVVALLPDASVRRNWMLQRGDMSEESIENRLSYSETTEVPFFSKSQNDYLFDLKLENYNESTELDFLVNKIINEVLYPPAV